jgi:hypothetical protein
MPTEAEFERTVIEWLRARGCWVAQTHTGYRPPAHKGIPDLVGLLPGGRFFGCECKRPGRPLSAAQVECLDQIKASGGLTCVCTIIETVRDVFGPHVKPVENTVEVKQSQSNRRRPAA